MSDDDDGVQIRMQASDATIGPVDQAVIDAFQVVWRRCGQLGRMTYRGAPILKNPVDLFAYQQIVFETRPAIIIETGTAHGGSALYLRDLCQTFNRQAEVLTIDITEPADLLPRTIDSPWHWLVAMQGDSIAAETIHRVKRWAGDRKGMVVLDSDHAAKHVLTEMRLYQEFVAVGGYMIVEDTNINGHPIYPGYGPGPWEAVEVFLEENPQWEVDTSREYLSTYNPRGYLKRLA